MDGWAGTRITFRSIPDRFARPLIEKMNTPIGRSDERGGQEESSNASKKTFSNLELRNSGKDNRAESESGV
jgi:hypothetical protein